MKRIMFQAILLLICLIPVGCASQQVPKSVITWDLNKGTGKLSLPKDANIEGLDVSVAPNKVISVRVQKLVVKTNPDVVGASGEATAKVVDATANAVQKAFEAGKKALVP